MGICYGKDSTAASRILVRSHGRLHPPTRPSPWTWLAHVLCPFIFLIYASLSLPPRSFPLLIPFRLLHFVSVISSAHPLSLGFLSHPPKGHLLQSTTICGRIWALARASPSGIKPQIYPGWWSPFFFRPVYCIYSL